jgi:4-hydroxy-tetrahydrodipicolinate synthase
VCDVLVQPEGASGMSDLSGVLSAICTPFTAGGESVDEAALRGLTEATVTGGVHGLVPGGSTGEFAAMTGDERRQVTEVVIDQAAGRVPVVPHVGAMTTREAIGLARHAEQAGAAGVMVVAPYYEPLTVAETKAYHRAVASAISIPVVVYNLPIATGVNLAPADVVELAGQVGNIRYLKDTTGDFSQAAVLVHQHADVISTFVGHDTLFYAALLEGAAGSIVGAANFIAPDLVSIWDSIKAGEAAAARSTWESVYPIMQFLVSGGYVTGVKGALDLLGRSVGAPREPIEPLGDDRADELKGILARYGSRTA